MEAAPLAYLLFTRFLKHNPADPSWVNRDRFVLSCGHASALLYGALHLSGYGVSLEDLKNFRQWGSKTPGHPERGLTPGVEMTTGPLGQGLAAAVGMAMTERHLAARFNRPGFDAVDYRTWVFASDGDMMEGLSSEAASLAGHWKLGRLKVVYLDNRITIDGPTDLAFSEDVGARFAAFGWRVLRVPDAEDLASVEKTFRDAQTEHERPTLVVIRTHIGFGAPTKQDTCDAHGAPLGPAEAAAAKKALGWPAQPAFHVPDEVRERFRREMEKGPAAQAAWTDTWTAWRKAHPDLGSVWDAFWGGVLPPDWPARLPVFKAGEKLATRQASGKVLNALAAVHPWFIGGSADLSVSNNTLIEGEGNFRAGDYGARNVHFGVREHAMAAILNGVALTGPFIPYGGTFLVFSDYMKPALRLAAIMGLGVVYVMTHDSIGVGEDGPTHQPVDQLASLRAIPNVTVLRPADAAETAWAWRIAVERRKGPTVLVLSRQKLPVLDRSKLGGAQGAAKGAYVLSPGSRAKPQVILIATGSEVSTAMAAQSELEGRGVPTRVVSMPSWELFEEQPLAYKEEVLPAAVRPRVAVEAGCPLGWRRYVGPQGALVTMERFGASAPAEVLMERFGFTAGNVAAKALEIMNR